MPQISVIVPVYNAEKYLRRCVDSILAQTFTDFELLLVDDGSTDGSGAICDEYAKRDNRVEVLTKLNGGVSSARNLGLDNAIGEWIAFIDADDWITKDYLASFAPIEDDEFLIQSFFVDGDSKSEKFSNFANQVYSKSDVSMFVETTMGLNWAIIPSWGKLFRREIIERKNLRFNEHLTLGEDVIFCLSYVSQISKLRSIDAECYHYKNVKETGKSLSVRALPLSEFIEYVELLYPLLESLQWKGYIKYSNRCFCSNVRGYMRRTRIWIVGSPSTFFQKIYFFRTLYKHPLVKLYSENVSFGREHWFSRLAKLHQWFLITILCVWSNRKEVHDFYMPMKRV